MPMSCMDCQNYATDTSGQVFYGSCAYCVRRFGDNFKPKEITKLTKLNEDLSFLSCNATECKSRVIGYILQNYREK